MPLPQEVLKLLRQWKSVTPYNAADDWVFASPLKRGKAPLWPQTLFREHIGPVVIEAGLPEITSHSFRHSVDAWAKAAGLKIDDVKTLNRHAQIETAAEIYGEADLDDKRRMQRQMMAYVKKKAKAEARRAARKGRAA